MSSINSKPNQQAVYIWNILGSLTNALLSMVSLMIVTRTVTGKEADIFSIAWAISQLMSTIGTFQIRNYQATDVKEVFKFKQYFVFRILTIFIMMVSSIGYVFVKEYDFYKSLIIMIVCGFRAIDSLADIYEGLFQQKERLDLAGKAITFRVVFATVVFGVVLFCAHNLLAAVFSLALSYIIGFIYTDLRYYFGVANLRSECKQKLEFNSFFLLFKEGLPLFVNAFLMMAITNEPKMAIDRAIECGNMTDGTQTIFSILFMPASVLTLVYIVFRPMITQMAILWSEKKISKFMKIIYKIGVCLLLIAVVVMIGSAILGIPVLSVIYAIDLSDYRIHLLTFVFGGCFCTFSYVLDNALIVIRCQYMLIFSYLVTWIYVKIITNWLVSKFDMLGAAFSYASSMIVFFCFTAFLFLFYLSKAKKLNQGIKDNARI